MIFDELQKENIQSMKDHDKVKHEVISLIFGRAKNTAIDKGYADRKLPDNECLQLIQKFIKELEEERLNFERAGRSETVEKLEAQKKILEAYLPKQMSQEEIKAEISKLEDKSIPSVMKYFKTNFQGQCDMSLVSKIAKEFN